MYLLFYGQNSYEIEKKLSALREKFLISDPSGINLGQLNGETLTWGSFSSEVSAMPFLASKRLIIIRNLLLNNKDNELKKKIAQSLDKISETSVVIFADMGLPDQRGALFKTLNKPKISQKFELFSSGGFSNWLRDEAEKQECGIERNALDQLSLSLESDQWRGQREIEKLCLYAKSQKRQIIKSEDVDKLVTAKSFATIFDFVDGVANKNEKKAFSALNILKQNGEAPHYIFSMIVYQFRVMLKIADLSSKKMGSSQIASKAKIHPFVVSKTLNLLSKYQAKKLEENYILLKKADADMKSGQIPIETTLDLLVFNFCK